MGGQPNDDRGGDQEGSEGEGGALEGEAEGEEGDWVSAELIGGDRLRLDSAFLGWQPACSVYCWLATS
jgi:hypothetical protein